MSKFETLRKTVRVSDPVNWYGKETVNVTLSVIDPYDEDAALVEILVEASNDNNSDPLAMGYWFLSQDRSEKDIEWAYNKFRDSNYGKMPNEISFDWLWAHGYRIPFNEFDE